MKRIVAFLLLAFYTTFNLGLVMNTHYCGGKVSSVSFNLNSPASDSCSLCGKKEAAMNCCQDTQTQLSIDDDQMSSQVNVDLSDFSSLLVAILPSYYTIAKPNHTVLNQHNNHFYVFETGPPKTPVYIQTHSLLI